MGAFEYSYSKAQTIEKFLTEEDLYKCTITGASTYQHENQKNLITCNKTRIPAQCLETGEEKHDDRYGYEEASPGRRRSMCTPRRSSLKKNSESTKHRRTSISYRSEMTLVLPTGKRIRKRSSISFAEETENQVKEVKPVSNMVDDPNQLWFQAEDYKHFKRDLEPIMHGNAQEARQEANTSVLEEYLMQKSRGEYNCETIKQIYSLYTIDSQVEADYKAELNQKEIQAYLQDTRTSKVFC